MTINETYPVKDAGDIVRSGPAYFMKGTERGLNVSAIPSASPARYHMPESGVHFAEDMSRAVSDGTSNFPIGYVGPISPDCPEI